MESMEDSLDRPRSGVQRKDWIERQNLEIRGTPDLIRDDTKSGMKGNKREMMGSKEELRGSRDLLRVPCASLSTLTGLSTGSRVVRPCQVVRGASTGRGASTRRTSPSMLLQHGYDWISAEDQKILSIMAMRREAQMEQEDMLLSARNLWEKDRILYNQMVNEKRKQWNEYLQERRRAEKMELELRKESAEVSLQRRLAELEHQIHERHSRCEQRHSQIVMQKRLPRGDVDADTLNHRLRREQQQQEELLRSAMHVNAVEAKERRVQDNLNAILCYRDRTLKERRSKREKRMAAAQQLREALNIQFDDWREENQRLTMSKLCLSEQRAAKLIDWRRKITHDNNQIKMVHHLYAMAQLDEEERAKELRARQELLKKEMKIRTALDRKEQAVLRSRMKALTTASLRQKIKASYQLK